jgi:hypothetical protein
MVAVGTKIKHFKCISYHAKILKFSFGHKDFHITDFISCIVFATKPKVWDKKHFFPKNLKEATNDYFLYD